METRYKKPRALSVIAGLLLVVGAWQAQADPVGHLTDTAGIIHHNIADVEMFGGGGGVAYLPHAPYVGGACGGAGGFVSIYACSFFDTLNSPGQPWAWETAIQNAGVANLTANVGFFIPNNAPIFGTITLAPTSTFHFGVIVDDLPAPVFGDTGVVTGYNLWYAWKALVGQNIDVSAAVIEGTHAVPYIGPGDGIANTNGEFWYHFHSDPFDSFTIDETLTVADLDFTFMNPADAAQASSLVPIPGAVWLFGSGLLGLIGVARRKSRPV